MDEFLRINWKISHPSELENRAQSAFLSDEAIADVLRSSDEEDAEEEKKIPKSKRGPYTPGLQEMQSNKIATQSSIDQRGHHVCLEALKLMQSGKDRSRYTSKETYAVGTYDKLKLAIIQEHAKYQAFVAQQWQKKDKLVQPFNKKVLEYGQSIWERKKLRLKSYPQFYKDLSMVNTTLNADEEIIEFNCVENGLELDGFAQFCYPYIISPCQLNTNKLASEKDKQQLPLSEDNSVLNVLQSHGDVDVVISSSGIKCLVDATETGKWILPVVVKSVSKKVAFFEKPFSLSQASRKDLAHISYKRLIKTTFCFPEPKPKTTYRKWRVTKTNCQNSLMKTHHKPVELTVLVRNKTVASETTNNASQDVILQPKLEMQLKYGANVATKSELIGEWASLFFRPFSSLYRVRIAPKRGEVVCLEKCHLQKVIGEAQHHYHHKPQLGLGVLQKVFEAVCQLEPGNYLLEHLPHHGAFVRLLKQSDKQEFDFYGVLDKRASSDGNWVPIDSNFILPGFEALDRMPGMFQPTKTSLKRKMN